MNLSLQSVYRRPDSVKVLYDLLRSRSIGSDRSANISHRELPSWRAHLAFYRSRPYRYWFLIWADGKPAGSLTATWLNEIGIVLFPQFRGLGIGAWAVRYLITKRKPLRAIRARRAGHWLANVNPANKRSLAFFASLGFKQVQVTLKLEARVSRTRR